MAKTDTAITGACGEHFVAAYLSGHKLIVAMPRAGIRGSDLFVSSVKNGPAIRVQVKTGTQCRRKDPQEGEILLWYASRSAVDQINDYLWYAFVWLNGWPEAEAPPQLFIVPSTLVAARVRSCLVGCRN